MAVSFNAVDKMALVGVTQQARRLPLMMPKDTPPPADNKKPVVVT
jgi:hypothetical protein